MRRLCVAIMGVALAMPGPAQELATLSWDTTPPLAGRVTEDSLEEGSVLALENAADAPQTTTFARIENPGITASNYAVRGRVRYQDVEGVGYLEMWSLFPDGARYFSRTLGDVGPMQSISGSSDWREFVLPFSLADAPQRPRALILNLTLAGRGSVFIGPLRLAQYESEQELMAALGESAGEVGPPGWWNRAVGAVLLVLGSCALVLAGGLTFWLARRGQARAWGVAFPWCTLLLGCGALIGGFSATMARQPAWVQNPLIGLGFLAILLGVVLLKLIPARYAALQTRRERSQNLG